MKIGIFGGSFDPVHNEHVNLVREGMRSLGLDKLLVMPAFQPPHKQGKRLTPDANRLRMCSLAFEGIDGVEVSDYEIAQKGTSYTYLTCRYFKDRFRGDEIFLLVGTDMLRNFPTWKNPEDILQNATLAVCARNEKDEWIEAEQIKFFERFGKNFAVIRYNGKDVSSTKIRVLAGAGMDLSAFLPEKVTEYIERNGLYEIPFARQALGLEKESRRAHSVRVAQFAAKNARRFGILEDKAIVAALFHDCAKNLEPTAKELGGFEPPLEWGEIPKEVLHQFQGAYVAEHSFHVQDENVLNAIRYHTSGRPNMSALEKLIFLADMLEEERQYDVVDILRELFFVKGLDECLERALLETLLFLEKKGGEIYPLTKQAYEFYRKK
ncbi:MAG: nicotinate (nicotinamide) nucleotide adenylyltransferase [Clostridia bacterium]|nr:nicotinate (nicotinamide) nucleotide adenylyltransferase [Clostridia bacterium]